MLVDVNPLFGIFTERVGARDFAARESWRGRGSGGIVLRFRCRMCCALRAVGECD